jgi:pimeloyl-ACP methyl ester carboxylesterase
MFQHSHPLLAMLSVAICLLTNRSACALEDQFFNSDGVRIRYIVEGEGEPVLLIHGFGANLHLQWGVPGVLKSLTGDYRVIAYDNRGHGRSGKPHDAAKYGEAMVEDAVRLLDHLGISRAHIVGYSMGAFITDKLLCEHPERFLSATLGGGGWRKANDERADFIDEVVESLEQDKGIGPLLIKLSPEDRPKPSGLKLRLASWGFGLVNDEKALAEVARGMKEFAVSKEQLLANRVPTLAVIGETDPLKITVDELAEVMPNVEVHVIKDADHMRAFLRPEFGQILKKFLAEHSSGAR